MKINKIPNLVSADWLNNNIHASNLIVLDATINKVIDAASIRIPNARFLDIKKKFSDTSAPFPSTLPSKEQFQNEAQLLGINQDAVIVVYDDKGIYSSARIWWLFKVFGFDTVAVLNGGLPQWQELDYSVESYKNETYDQGNFVAKYHPDLMTNFKGINKFSIETDTLIIDARSADRFNCKVDEPKEGLRRGTIPNSKNIPYTTLLNGYELKSKVELSKILNNLVDDKTNLVFSCGSGITACILALAATICDYKNLVVYDGSWTEYGSLT
ncbi:sulfurtransferase [Winogradskyella bathintestinalis]|uniref:Sulfurtransferase n=1 Tax=Winogradskyella bathintestinalis TaxID=3035208 RepID=A0ABT7ZXW9_9FLAO|nr:sulfurtransferase [Winogradskyella bathintestinalis]MDN3493583.1 sulfurtransferase [Winogradskyella bathintestinalis]